MDLAVDGNIRKEAHESEKFQELTEQLHVTWKDHS